MGLSEHFSYSELTSSGTAMRLSIFNHPDDVSLQNLTALCNEVLEPIRTEYGKPIVVTSGYRNKLLNKYVGGALNSDHTIGCAADIRSLSDSPKDNKELFDIAESLVKSGRIKVRQLIDEYKYSWIHISINRGRDTKYNQVLHLG